LAGRGWILRGRPRPGQTDSAPADCSVRARQSPDLQLNPSKLCRCFVSPGLMRPGSRGRARGMPGSHASQQPGSSASSGRGVLSPVGTPVPARTLQRLKTCLLETKAVGKSHLSGLPSSGFRPASAAGRTQSSGLISPGRESQNPRLQCRRLPLVPGCRPCHGRPAVLGSQPGARRRSPTSEAAPSPASRQRVGSACSAHPPPRSAPLSAGLNLFL